MKNLVHLSFTQLCKPRGDLYPCIILLRQYISTRSLNIRPQHSVRRTRHISWPAHNALPTRSIAAWHYALYRIYAGIRADLVVSELRPVTEHYRFLVRNPAVLFRVQPYETCWSNRFYCSLVSIKFYVLSSKSACNIYSPSIRFPT